MKTIAITRTVTSQQEVQVPLNEVKHTEIMSMNHAQLRSYASAMRMLMKDSFNIGSNLPIINHDPVSNAVPLGRLEPEAIAAETPIARKRGTGKGINSNLGKKTGKTSKYHLVHFNAKSGQYAAAIKYKGKSCWLGTHEDPRMAAMIVDGFLDGIEDKKRTRNRDEFPEIAELYDPNMKDTK